ncbi:hypothetical protein CH298_13430 [Rhodococcoides fascians]|uniref:hypothetical protein n=1 Tax=Rhodococcoides fascians TaxID=1828 RepID=UPI000B9B940E|nr:hypothetical protein [Rhodococcus fascians]OZE89979.1 hypothetical protein CH303_13310 [Rhodococcus fascians]OZF18286.1 hypothetical protein CH298_13430 [Rhodococcus fascians]OZF21737.1 hypothetical protein CH297_13325 [Rhodococcus fascians]OZF67362.1 hypothetical protein CH308_13225 [Rhodococcus fascians]OZF70552.1 hypothetical protein CH307_13420 [Rhodococcus fascians]
MSALVVPHPAQAVAITAVTERLPAEYASAWVAGEIPDKRRPLMVRITRIPGGGVPHHGATDHANYIVECWAADEPAAERFSTYIGALWRSLPGQWAAGAFIRYSRCTAAYSWPDPDQSRHDQARWQFTAELDIKVD